MNDFTTEIVQTLVTKGDLNELFRSHLEKVGSPGVGKTHLTIALGIEACRQGYRTLILTCHDTFDQSKPNMVN
ncbi:hypothetical protein EfmAA96_09110 [Enterococcus faecium]|nr:hypothetical protein EfmAA96_09110 [Enterococcus faecium]